MADRAPPRALPLLGALLISIPPAGFAQSGCSNDTPIVFRDPSGISLNSATVRNLTGNNNDDRAIELNFPGALETTASGGELVVSGIDPDDFPSEGAALRSGFNRTTGRFWETNYTNGQYVFANRGDLEVEVTLQVASPLAPTRGSRAGRASTASLVLQQRNINTQWWGGSNSLRRLRGQVRIRFEDLELLTQAGEHSADISVCVEISGNL